MKTLNEVFKKLGIDPVVIPDMPPPITDLTDRITETERQLNITNLDISDDDFADESEPEPQPDPEPEGGTDESE